MIVKFKLFESLNIMPYVMGDGGIIITVNDQEDYWLLMKELEKFGYNWSGVEAPLTAVDNNHFNPRNIDYSIRLRSGKKLSHSDLKFYETEEEFKYIPRVNFKDINFNAKYKKNRKSRTRSIWRR